ncbi:hypothetical protein E4U19_000130 [Claviceps sp. Clav32 group G5]|nr:hypothetical protein E4U19_000130 [Claviceps sp. Clav32 group G5]
MSTPALCFIADSLRWCNAMWSCSMRQAPVLPDGDTNALLQMQTKRTDTEYLSQAIYCQDWVIASIIEVVELDVWKKGAAKTGTLSGVELVKRAHDIETSLKLRLQRAKDAFPFLYTERHLPSSLLHSTAPPVLTHYVTEVFATAALVYLHVVISGARRQEPDVHNHVRDAITLFRCRCCAQALSSLCWPLCLTGCLAEGEDRVFVLNLAISAAAETSGGWESIEGDFIEGDFIEGDFIEGDFIEGDFIEGDFSDGDFIEGDFIEGDLIEGDFSDGDFIEGDFIEGDLIEGDFSDGDLAESRVTMSCGVSTGAATAMLAKAAITRSPGRMLRLWLYKVLRFRAKTMVRICCIGDANLLIRHEVKV